MITFDHVYRYSNLIDENEFFQQYFNEYLPYRYDSNFFILKYQPTLAEFELIENMQLAFHEEEELEHLKFYWPQDKGFTPEIVAYFEESGYQIEMLELFQIDPNEFSIKVPSNIHVSPVSEHELADFKQLNYPQDLTYGSLFADMKQDLYTSVIEADFICPLIAYINGTPVGSLIALIGQTTIEIDDLYVSEEFRNKGVATALQTAVMTIAKEKKKQVILVADADDTPREMYLKQGYAFTGYQLAAQKILGGQEE